MIRLQSSLITDLVHGDLHALRRALQQAVELEHSTIPPYLYAMYSLGQGVENATVAAIIGSVAVEEMLHMTLVCNVLNAIGGAPVIDTPHFIPDYPGPLPGGVQSQLTVALAPFSLDVIKNVFMEIEEPEAPIEFPVLALAAVAPPNITIGQFYTAIKQKLTEFGEAIFTGPASRQVPPPFPEGKIVTNLASALEAIDLIIDQGEGTSLTPVDVDGDLAHYYRYAEIYYGRTLIKNPDAQPTDPPDQQYLYGGTPITFDAAAIPSLPPNPKAANYAPGTAQRHAMDNFNYTYTSLLKALHLAFNGQPSIIRQSIGLMMSLRQQALDMMSATNLPEPVGPSFEYLPVNPA